MSYTEKDHSSLIECRKVFHGQFMQPRFYTGAQMQLTLMEAGLDVEDDSFYCRLSADGFLDCTDWQGPFRTIDEAAQALIDLHTE